MPVRTSKRNKMGRKSPGVTVPPDALTKTFLTIGKKNGVGKNLLLEILELLMKSQYLAKGDRTHVRSQLRRLILKHEGK